MTDEERSEVARRLRRIKDTREGCGHDLCCDLWSAVFDSDYRCTDLCDECEVAVLNSLADLIEPSDMSHGCRDTVACDREALLALADELDEVAWKRKASDGWTASVVLTINRYTDRIREACGVVG